MLYRLYKKIIPQSIPQFPGKLILLILSTIFFHQFAFARQDQSATLALLPPNSRAVSPAWIDSTIPESRPLKKRIALIAALNAAGYGGSLLAFNQAWYVNYPRSSFHFFNDNGEWLQADKVGHSWAAYNAGKASAALWRWAGLSQKKAALIGGISGTAYLTVIEILDGFSSQWGFSWGDMTANVVGSGLFTIQELAWQEQRIQYKFSFHRNSYHHPDLNARADQLFGNSWYERMLKDYNAQTYWLSLNLKSFLKGSRVPAWLNISFGYGADGMFGGYQNKWIDAQGNAISRDDIARTRQFYLAPDIDFTKIKSGKKWVRTALYFLNAFKCPAPALMISSKGKIRSYLFYF